MNTPPRPSDFCVPSRARQLIQIQIDLAMESNAIFKSKRPPFWEEKKNTASIWLANTNYFLNVQYVRFIYLLECRNTCVPQLYISLFHE